MRAGEPYPLVGALEAADRLAEHGFLTQDPVYLSKVVRVLRPHADVVPIGDVLKFIEWLRDCPPPGWVARGYFVVRLNLAPLLAPYRVGRDDEEGVEQ